jgi:hypothetical protein
VCRLIVVNLLNMAECESPTRELCSEGESASFGWNVDCRRRNWPNWPICTGITWVGSERGERNVSLLNIVNLAHGLNVRVPKLVETIR